ncbi:hypothetical protein Cni_G02487 [Canna indica]|uniref:Uncharacterized protein n=1 Tax=Canna indica TaxID=4628 RepID=A0AAQ3JPV5_9LILI|nr:hypothetical protein Cni_G02487 [Canna indica]
MPRGVSLLCAAFASVSTGRDSGAVSAVRKGEKEKSQMAEAEQYIFGPYIQTEEFYSTALSYVMVNLRPVVPGTEDASKILSNDAACIYDQVLSKRQKRKLDEMYDKLWNDYESVKRSTIKPANFFPRAEPNLFSISSMANMMDARDTIGQDAREVDLRSEELGLLKRPLEADNILQNFLIPIIADLALKSPHLSLEPLSLSPDDSNLGPQISLHLLLNTNLKLRGGHRLFQVRNLASQNVGRVTGLLALDVVSTVASLRLKISSSSAFKISSFSSCLVSKNSISQSRASNASSIDDLSFPNFFVKPTIR